MRNVYIVGQYGNLCEYGQMFMRYGWGVTQDINEASLIQFTGGSDVSPELYGEQQHPKASVWRDRDNKEKTIFDYGNDNLIPMAGICRGGQFLNVMNGGKMWQHVFNHAIGGTHEIIDLRSDKRIQVSSTHHQMMRPSPSAEVIAIADNISKTKQHMNGDKIHSVVECIDHEVLFYPSTESLCFQPHPEFNNVKECTDYYFHLIEHCLFP